MSHEYRVTIAVPMSGTDRVQSALKAKIGPLIDELERAIALLGVEPVVVDTTVRLKMKGEARPLLPANGLPTDDPERMSGRFEAGTLTEADVVKMKARAAE